MNILIKKDKFTMKGNSTNNDTATVAEVRSGLAAYGYSSTGTSTLATSTIRSQLANGKPIMAGYIMSIGGIW